MSTSNSMLPIYGVDNLPKTANFIFQETEGYLPLSVSIHTWDDVSTPAASAEKTVMVSSQSTTLQVCSGIHEETIAIFLSASFTSMDTLCF
jgi:hypothetical protein